MASNLGNKEIMSQNIKRYMETKGLNAKDFALSLDFKYSTVLDWLNAKTYPRIDKIERMSDFFGVNKADLVEEYTNTPTVKAITETAERLEEPRRVIVLDTAKQQLDEQEKARRAQEKAKTLAEVSDNVIAFPTQEDNDDVEYDYYDQAASAGTGQYLGDVKKETISLPIDVDADFVIPVNGYSMEPEYQFGDYIFIKLTVNLNDGDIGVFSLDGDVYIKQLIINENGAYLHSLNPNYKDMPIKPDSDFRVIGKVVGNFVPVER